MPKRHEHFGFVVDAILHPHGPSLIELRLEDMYLLSVMHPVLRAGLFNLAQTCSSLKYLTLALCRRGRDAHEVTSYKTLGSLPQQKCLFEVTDVVCPESYGPPPRI